MAEQLARIAQHYRFDGWLINIENTLSVSPAASARCPAFVLFLWGAPALCPHPPVSLSWQAAAVGNLPLFLQDLTARVHSAVPGGLVIWYDSVLKDGTLRWQNELNNANR